MASRPSLPLPTLSLAVLLVNACAAEGNFPSLLPREVERNVSTAEPVREPVAVASNPVLRGRAEELLALARRADRDFESAYGAASAAAGRAGSPGSESWVLAQQAISRVEAARAETTRALGELDALAVERARQATHAADFTAIHAAAEEAGRLAANQQERLDRLRRAVRPG